RVEGDSGEGNGPEGRGQVLRGLVHVQVAHAVVDHGLAEVHGLPHGSGPGGEVQVQDHVHRGEVVAAQVHAAEQVPAGQHGVRRGIAGGHGAVAHGGGVHVAAGDDLAHIALEGAQGHINAAAILRHGHVLVRDAAADHDRGGGGRVVGDRGWAVNAAAVIADGIRVVVVGQGIGATRTFHYHLDGQAHQFLA